MLAREYHTLHFAQENITPGWEERYKKKKKKKKGRIYADRWQRIKRFVIN